MAMGRPKAVLILSDEERETFEALGEAAKEQPAIGTQIANRVGLWRRPHESASCQRIAH